MELAARVDVAVVGAGVVGLAAAVELCAPGRQVLVLERHGHVGTESSSRNSEVIHAGIYYPPGSLKARLCLEGRERLYALCAAAGIAHRRIGKLIVAPDEAGAAALAGLLDSARAAGVQDLRPIEGKDLPRLEPAVRGAAALLSPSTGILDSHGLLRHYAGRLRDGGAVLALRTAVAEVRPARGALLLRALGPDGDSWVQARVVVLAAGLHTDRLAATAGLAAAVPEQVAVKGEYFFLRRRGLVSRLVYPVPPAVGLGVHVTLDLAGQARLGPNALPLERAAAEAPGALAVDPAHAGEFLAAARSYLPCLRAEDLQPGYAGIRPRLRPSGFADFWVRDLREAGAPGLIALCGIESPGLTAAPALAALVRELASPYL